MELTLRGAVLALAVEGQHQFMPGYRRDKRCGAGGQYQLVVAPFAILTFHHFRCGVEVTDPGVREQTQMVLLGEFARRLQGQIVGTLAAADHMAEVRFVVLIHAVGGDQRQRNVRILLTNIFYQLAGRKARADDHDTIAHTASVARTSNTSLPREHSGHRKLSGTSLHGVPGWTSWFGSPVAGS